jgi:hypothetical protein
MKPFTRFIALVFTLSGVMGLLIFLVRRDFTVIPNSIIGLTAGINLLNQRVLGWWMVVSIIAISIPMSAVNLVLAQINVSVSLFWCKSWPQSVSTQRLQGTAIVGLLTGIILLIALLRDRPSSWQTNTKDQH